MEHIIVSARISPWESGVVIATTSAGIKILCKFEHSTLKGEKAFAKRIVGHTVYLTAEEEKIIKKYPDSYRLPERWLKQPSDLKYPYSRWMGASGGVPRHNPRISLREWIRENRQEIDEAIRRVVPDARIDDEERCLWILNDEGLYNWAKSEGVRL